MAEIKNRVPKRRFKEFQDAGEWEERKLGEISNSYSGGTPSVGNSSFYGADIPFIRSGEIHSSSTEIFLTNEGLNNSSAKFVHKGDILYALYGATSGEVGISKISGAINQAILAIQPIQNYDTYFISQWLRKEKNNIVGTSLQGGQGNLSGSIVKDLSINFPKYNEQQKIGNFFQNLDSQITLQQRKLEKIKAMKKAYLSEMFPAAGQTKPKRRFKGFTEDWVEKKLGEVVEFNPNSDIPNEFEYVDLESVVGTELIAHRTISKSNAPSRAQRLAKQGDLFYQTVRPYQKNNYLFDKNCKNYVFSTGYAQMRPKIEGYFLLSYVQTDSFVDHIMSRCTGTSYPAISSSDMENMVLSIPIEKEEQLKISSFLKGLDKQITLHQKKLSKLQNLKKAYLNEMFI
ncbi:restriction endonuclease subunit S [Marinifilum fragile]|uniref:restriction endonuclease subunit S n=1 Tax=Marinifilum fragile TaxID=570161 RepID=UPI002AA738E7|nr:restriction endonuclease subunit S [Marinifilum fragile]